MGATYEELSEKANTKIQWDRDDVSSKIIDFTSRKKEISQRKFCEEQGIARTTFQVWLNRISNINADPAVISFFESPKGLEFLHQLICALHFAFTKVGCASIRNICHFIELCGLSEFVAASYATHQKISREMDSMLNQFSEMEQSRLSKKMPFKLITLCEDETFIPQPCLVGMEPVSNFILVEEYASDRSGETWNRAVDNALSDLPVKVVQCTSDEAKGLVHHATKGLKGHHSSDLFHVTHEISKGTSAALASKIKHAEKEYETSIKTSGNYLKEKEKFDNLEKRPVGRPPDFEKRIQIAQNKEHEAKKQLEEAIDNQEIVRKQKIEIGRAYHPYNPLSGEKQDALTVSKKLDDCFDQIRIGSKCLSERCHQRIDKAYRVTGKMTATIAFFFLTITSLVKDLYLAPDQESVIHERLIPGFYLQHVSEKESDPERRQIIHQRSKELLSILDDMLDPFSDCGYEEREQIIRIAQQCAGLFQRSSSCVEGRNAQLSLHRHGMHRMSGDKLKALTVVHNYYLKRPDGTTAAERFFENKPIDMFEWLRDKMPLPPRPRCRTKKAV